MGGIVINRETTEISNVGPAPRSTTRWRCRPPPPPAAPPPPPPRRRRLLRPVHIGDDRLHAAQRERRRLLDHRPRVVKDQAPLAPTRLPRPLAPLEERQVLPVAPQALNVEPPQRLADGDAVNRHHATSPPQHVRHPPLPPAANTQQRPDRTAASSPNPSSDFERCVKVSRSTRDSP